MAWHKSYRYRFKFTIDSDNIDAALTDFPVALHINGSAGTGSRDLTKVFDVVGARWNNLCVCAQNEVTPLWTEVDVWDADNETGILHVRVPKISAYEDTDLYLYFDADGLGNGFIGATGSAAGQAVWDDDFVGVYHLNTAPTSVNKDSTAYGYDMGSVGSMTSDDLIDAHPGKGIEFDGSNDGLYDTPASPITAYPCTLEAAGPVHVVASNNSNPFVGFADASATNQQEVLGIYNGYARLNHYVSGVNYFATGTVLLVEDDFCHIATTLVSATERNVFTNGGDKQTDTTSVGFPTGIDRHCIGFVYDSTPTYAPGTVSEARFSKIARSDAWIAATYNTLADSLGAWESVEGIQGAPTVAWLGSWQNRIKFFIDADQIDEDLTDFPVALILSEAAGTTDTDLTAIFDALGANSHKIAVTDHTGIRQLFVEVDAWDETAESAVLHVKVPHVDADTDTVLYLYFDANKADNDGYVGDPGDTVAQEVWDENFFGVYHLGEDPTGTVIDSSRWGNDLTGASGDTFISDDLIEDAYPGKGIYFSGNNHDVLSNYNGSGIPTNYPTMIEVAGIYDSSYPQHPYATYCKGNSDSLWLQTSVANGYGRALLYSGASWSVSGTQALVNGEFCHIVGSWEDRDTEYVFTNGGDKTPYVGTIDRNYVVQSDRTICIGGKDDYSDDAQEGITSEARFSKVIRSDAWVKATYHTLADSIGNWAYNAQTGAATVESCPGVGWLRGFTYRTQVSIAATNIDASLDYFPVTLFLSSSCGTGTADMTAVFDEIGANSKKIGVTLADGKTQLPVEIDYWDDTGETAVLHVRVPSISSEEATYLYLYYSADVPDNDEFVGDTGEAPAMSVWDENFVGVYHMGQDPSGTAPQLLDSTVNAVHGTANGTMLTEDLVDGGVGQAIDFDGSDDFFGLTDFPTDFGDRTIEAVAKLDSTASGALMTQDYNGSQDLMNFQVYTDNFLLGFRDSGGGWDTTTGIAFTDTAAFHYFAATVDGAAMFTFLDDGTSTQTGTISPGQMTTRGAARIGTQTNDLNDFDGQMSELRVSKTPRLSAWMKATYYSLFDGLIAYNTEIETEDNWLGDWGYRIQVKVDSSLIDEDLTDFPVALNLGGAVGINGADVTAIFDELGANSLKIAVATADGTQCPVEIDTWDETGETAVLHTMIPSIYADRDTIFYLYYDSAKSDNSTYVGVTGSTPAQGVWDDSFALVYHFAQDPTDSAPQVKDSTANGFNGTCGGTMTSDDLVDADGPVGKAYDLDGSNDEITKTSESLINFDGTVGLTVEAVVNKDEGTVRACISDKRTTSAGNGYLLGIHENDNVHLFVNDGTNYEPAGNTTLTVDGTTWYHLSGVWDPTGDDDAYVLVNGVIDCTPVSTAACGSITNTGTLHLFDEAYSGSSWDPFNGRCSEYRISRTARSDAWLKATYHTLFDTLVTFGTVEAIGSDWSAFVGWNQRIPFTIPATNIDENLISFPVALALSDSAGTGSDDMTAVFDGVGGNYRRVAVGAANGKPIPCEIEVWDDTAESAVLHVKAPLIEADHGAKLYLYFNDNQPDRGWVGDTGEYIAQRVWNDDFTFVFHMNQTPGGAGSVLDSTGNLTGTPTNMEAGDIIDGQVGAKAYDFDGSNEWLDCGSDSQFNLGAATYVGTMEVVAKVDDLSGTRPLFGNDRTGISYGFGNLQINPLLSPPSVQFVVSRSGSTPFSWIANHTTEVTADGNFHYFSAAIDTPADEHELLIDDDVEYVSGVYLTQTYASILTTVDIARMHNYTYGTTYFDGPISEVRHSVGKRSVSWMTATYYTLFDDLGDWGNIEYEPAGGEIEETLGKVSIVFTPNELTTEVYIEEWLAKGRVAFTARSLTATYKGNIVRMTDADGSRPRIASASCQRPGIVSASGSHPRLAAAEAFEYQERE